LAQLAPVFVIYSGVEMLPSVEPWLESLILNVTSAYMIVIVTITISAVLSAVNDIYEAYPMAQQRPLKGFVQLVQLVVMIIGGPNQRVDFHDDPVEEFFYQLKGDMILKIAEEGAIYDVPIREGDVFFLPPHVRHSPQRPVPGSVGLVVEGARRPGEKDGFEWFCFACGEKVHRVEVEVADIVADLPPLFKAFDDSEAQRTCGKCGALHPGKEPPPGWVSI
jgi:3-hydroxyanthranilate 3,4-dioxygenase